jgi:hypothetical protein
MVFRLVMPTLIWAGLLCACGGDNAQVSSAPASQDAAAVEPGPCRDGDPAQQRHGATCLCCHSDEFGVAGSVDPAGPAVSQVVVTAANGDTAAMAPNLYDNFFRHYPLTPPLRVVVYGASGARVSMSGDAPSGDCNACHYLRGPVAPIHGP